MESFIKNLYIVIWSKNNLSNGKVWSLKHLPAAPAAPAEVSNGPLQASRPAARRSSPPISNLQSSALVLPRPKGFQSCS